MKFNLYQWNRALTVVFKFKHFKQILVFYHREFLPFRDSFDLNFHSCRINILLCKFHKCTVTWLFNLILLINYLIFLKLILPQPPRNCIFQVYIQIFIFIFKLRCYSVTSLICNVRIDSCPHRDETTKKHVMKARQKDLRPK